MLHVRLHALSIYETTSVPQPLSAKALQPVDLQSAPSVSIEAQMKLIGPATFERVLSRVLLTHDVFQPDWHVLEGRGPPTISVPDYISRIGFYIPQSSPQMWVTALLYIDRLLKHNTGLVLARNNVHRVIILSVVTALKFNEDKTYANEFFARVAGITLTELNSLELEFLRFIDFDLYISNTTFLHAVNTLSRVSDAGSLQSIESQPGFFAGMKSQRSTAAQGPTTSCAISNTSAIGREASQQQLSIETQ